MWDSAWDAIKTASSWDNAWDAMLREMDIIYAKY